LANQVIGGNMNKSESIKNLAVALSHAQAKMPKVKFDAVNPFLKNKYATLGAVIETAKPILAEFGFSIAQFPVSQAMQIGVTTILIHESGEFIEDTIYMTPEHGKGVNDAQSAGIVISYLRRYAYVSILGIFAEEDTDGADQNQIGSTSADSKVKEVMARNWNPEQTEAISLEALDKGLEPITAEDASLILDSSILPADVTPKAIRSWFRHYMGVEGTAITKAMAANTAYSNAKKTTGGKK
jgi:hypothetical protein